MNRRIKHKIFKKRYKLNYSPNQILIATKGLFLTPILMKNGYRYYMSHFNGKIFKLTPRDADDFDNMYTYFNNRLKE